jgi:hypothetical protein
MKQALAPKNSPQQLQKADQPRQIELREVSEADIEIASEEGYGDVDTGDEDDDADAEDENEDEDLEEIDVNGAGADTVCRREEKEKRRC